MAWQTVLSGFLLALATLIPLSIKWELDRRVIVPVICVIGLVSGLVVGALDTIWNLTFLHVVFMQGVIIGGAFGGLLLWRFFRDPERKIPDDEDAIVSPADGRVVYVKKIEKGMIPLSEKNGEKFSLEDFVHTDLFLDGGTLIGIGMSFLDVHVNRAPIGGRITLLKHIPGLFISLKRKEAVLQNERVLTLIENERLQLGMIQIASRLVRKIVPYYKQGQEVQRGDRIGVIRFGSQVDVILPDSRNVECQVRPGDQIKAGISIIARFL